MHAAFERRTVGSDPEAFAGGAYSRRSSWTQADSGAQGARSGAVDPQYRRPVAHAPAVLPELQDSASPISAIVRERGDSSGADRSGNTLRQQGAIDESESYIDDTFASAKGGGDKIGPTKLGKDVKIMAIVDRHGLPLAVTMQLEGLQTLSDNQPARLSAVVN
jgi:hypothetical protein